jgi:hypothetical protein
MAYVDRTLVESGTLGYVRDVPLLSEAETGLGADLSLYRFTSRLDDVYGRHPVSVHVFARFRFGSSGMQRMSSQHMH